MKKSFAVIFGLAFLALLDGLFAYQFPVDYTWLRISVIFHFCFLGMLVYLQNKPWKTRVLAGLLTGILCDFFVEGTFPFCAIAYAIAAYLCGLWPLMASRPLYTVLQDLFLAFLLDLIPYLGFYIAGTMNLGILRWLYLTQLLSFFINGAAVVLFLYLRNVMNRFFKIQSIQASREERRKYQRMKVQANQDIGQDIG